MPNARKSHIYALIALLGGLGLVFIVLMTTSVEASPGGTAYVQAVQTTAMPSATQAASPTPSPSLTPTPTPAASIYLPRISVFKTPAVELRKAMTSDLSGGKLQAFQPGEPIIYRASGVNNLGTPVPVGLRWDLNGLCDSGVVYSDTLTIPKDWEAVHYSTSPTCYGVYTATANLSYEKLRQNLVTRYAINPPGSIQINVQHGFDKCYYPDLDDMQVWWDSSPYVVYNLYLGGISFACDDQPLDAVWVHQAAQQGWQFILTWVGPQAPCSKYKHKMSSDPDEAYLEGKAEALAASAAATSLGFFGPKVIYYDLESYSGASTECRKAAKEFLRGWSEQLHALGNKSGAYGAPCTSYISDWVTVNPPPDDVWIAHWYLDEYDPDATVWGTPCLSDGLWSGYQRIKQYAGGHRETWGGVQLAIDSNVLNGEITVLPVSASAANNAGLASVVLERATPPLHDLGLFAPGAGWVIAGERLLATEDGGRSWQDITPQLVSEPSLEPGASGAHLLGARFFDRQHGWAAMRAGGGARLRVAYTQDGGQSWQFSGVGETEGDDPGVEAVYFEPLDAQRAYLAVKSPGGSSFSLGKLFFLRADGSMGIAWQERSLPLGEAVYFEDEANGWTAGGADGKQVYRTADGGLSWEEAGQFSHSQGLAELEGLPGMVDSAVSNLAGLPQGTIATDATGEGYAWAIVQHGACLGEKAPGGRLHCTQSWELLATEDGGINWEVMQIDD